jgi:hypothetical protein
MWPINMSEEEWIEYLGPVGNEERKTGVFKRNLDTADKILRRRVYTEEPSRQQLVEELLTRRKHNIRTVVETRRRQLGQENSVVFVPRLMPEWCHNETTSRKAIISHFVRTMQAADIASCFYKQ